MIAQIAKPVIGAGVGLTQMIQARSAKNRANQTLPPAVDINQASFLAELQAKRNSIASGADFAAGTREVDQTTANTQNAITKVTGGDAGGTIAGLIQAGRAGGAGKNQVFATGQQQGLQYNQMYGELMNKIAARRMQLSLYRSQQHRAEWAQKSQDAQKNMFAGLASSLGLGQQKQPGEQPIDETTEAAGAADVTGDVAGGDMPMDIPTGG
jgi:hypothetical protein